MNSQLPDLEKKKKQYPHLCKFRWSSDCPMAVRGRTAEKRSTSYAQVVLHLSCHFFFLPGYDWLQLSLFIIATAIVLKRDVIIF